MFCDVSQETKAAGFTYGPKFLTVRAKVFDVSKESLFVLD